MSDSDSDVDFNIQAPAGVRQRGQPKNQKNTKGTKGRPLRPSNSFAAGDESDSSPGRRKKGRKRPSDPRWDDSDDNDNLFNSDLDADESVVVPRGRSMSTTENRPPVRGGRPISSKYQGDSDDDSNDEPEERPDSGRKGGHVRARKRLSIRHDQSTASAASSAVGERGPPKPKPDAAALKDIYSTCMNLFQAHKITAENAFQLKFLDMMNDLIDMPEFDKNDMLGAGRMLETGAMIYVCRVDKTKSTVMDLASTLNIKKNQRKQREEGEGDAEGVDAGADDIPEDRQEEDDPEEARRKKKRNKNKKHKEDRFIADNSKISLALEDESAEGGNRRELLKKKFNDLLENDFDFDYEMHVFKENRAAQEEPSPANGRLKVPETAINFTEIGNLANLRFVLMPDYNPAVCDVWGHRLNISAAVGDDDNHFDAAEANVEPVIPDLPEVDAELVYEPAAEQPLDYENDAPLDDDNDIVGNVTFVQDDGNGNIVDAEVKVVNPRKIASLQEFYDMYSKIQSKFGWCGPTFVKPQFFLRPGTGNNQKKRTRKDPTILDYKNAIWTSYTNKYLTSKPGKTVFDERTIEVWSQGGRQVFPYLGIEDHDEDEFDLIDLETKPGVNEKFVPQVFKYFVDVRDSLVHRMYKLDPKDEGEDCQPDFVKEEEALLRGVGFDVEHDRHQDDNFDGDAPHDISHEVEYEGTGSFAMPGSIENFFLETDRDPSNKTDAETLRFTNKPKPIDMHALKKVITRFLSDKLQLNADGTPRCEEETRTDMVSLIAEVYTKVDSKMRSFLSISIIMVGLLHVVVDKKLFMFPNPNDDNNPTILCRGSLWVHGDNIPLPDPADLLD